VLEGMLIPHNWAWCRDCRINVSQADYRTRTTQLTWLVSQPSQHYSEDSPGGHCEDFTVS